jgi:integrase
VVQRLKNSLSVEHPIAGAELRALKRYLATRDDRLPWPFVSERGQPFTRQAINYLIGQSPGRRACSTSIRIRFATAAAMPWPIAGRTCELSKTV